MLVLLITLRVDVYSQLIRTTSSKLSLHVIFEYSLQSFTETKQSPATFNTSLSTSGRLLECAYLTTDCYSYQTQFMSKS